MNPDQERWTEALAIERQHGAEALRFVVELIGMLAPPGDFRRQTI
jgi:hypothetical protein